MTTMHCDLTSAEIRELDERGFVILPEFFNDLLVPLRSRIDAVFADEGERAGSEFRQEAGCRRLANLIDKGEIFQQVIGHPAVLPYVRYVLNDQVKLSSLNVRSVNPRWTQSQPLHADMGAVADEAGNWVCNVVWMIDDITAENGPIRAIPGTHRLRKLPSEVLTDLEQPHADEVLITGRAGTVVVMNAHLWHGVLETTRIGRGRRCMLFIAAAISRNSNIRNNCCGRKFRRRCRLSCVSYWLSTIP